VRSDRERWDRKYQGRDFVLSRSPNLFLKRNIGRLGNGKALDLASGEGRNAVFLAAHGFDVTAVDISEMGLKKTERLSEEKGVRVKTVQSDLDDFRIERSGYDLIADFYFLDRKLIPKIRRGLRKGGKVIFETYTLEQRMLTTRGPKNPEYFLRPNELLSSFSGFRILFYREGVFTEGGRQKAVASLIAQKM
jgi:tellurite methyltransferase